MIRREGQVKDEYERLVPGAEIYVFNQDGTDAQLYVDAAGTIPLPVGDPVETDQFGAYSYYVAAGYYREDTYYSAKLRYKEIVGIGAPVLSGTQTLIATSRAALAGFTGMSAGQSAALGESGREGTFVFDSSNFVTKFGAPLTTIDPLQGIYVPPSSDTTGASGAWVRAGLGSITISDYMFGAVDGADNADAIEAWADFCWNHDVGQCACVSTGTLSRGISVGTTAATARPATGIIHFGPTLNASAAMDYMVTLANVAYSKLDFGGCRLIGAAARSVALSGRLAKVGLRYSSFARTQVSGTITVDSMYYWGVLVNNDIGSNNYGEIPFVEADYCGSCQTAGGTSALTDTWSSPAVVGSAGSVTQTTTLTVVSGFTDGPSGQMQTLAKINGYPYRVSSLVGTTLTLSQPWLDNASVTAGSGSLGYIFGGALAITGGDSSRCYCHGVSASWCGFGVQDKALYGCIIQHIGCNSFVDVMYGVGTGHNSSHVGGKVISYYVEDLATIQVLDFSATVTSAVEIGNSSGDGIDFTTWYKHGPRNTTTTGLRSQAMDSFTASGYEGKIIVAQLGTKFTATYDPPSIAAGGSASTTMSIAAGANIKSETPVRVTFSNSLSGLILFGSVTTTGNLTCTVTATFYNPTAGAVDLASGTLTVELLK